MVSEMAASWTRMPLLLAVLQMVFQPAEFSGHLQVGFFLYEFQHDPVALQLPLDLTGPPDSNVTDTLSSVTSSDLVKEEEESDVFPVEPWQVRSQVPGEAEEVGLSSNDSSSSSSSSSSPVSIWRRRVACNETSFTRPQYSFLLCLDYFNSKSAADTCRLGSVQLSALSHLGTLGRDLVTFPLAVGVTLNGTLTSSPVIFGFQRWRGDVQLSVHVHCCGVGPERQTQCQETLSFIIHHIPAPFSLPLSPQNVMLTGRGRLVVDMMLQCDEGFYGPACDVSCYVSLPSSEHAFCNMTSGQRQCMHGWEGEDCQMDVDECLLNFCQNDAHCINSPGSFTCLCQLGTAGRLCEKRTAVCHTNPCQNNGTCHDTPFGFFCFCPEGFTGYRCARAFHAQLHNDSAYAGGDLGNVAYSSNNTNEGYMPPWQHWYTAVLVCVTLVFVCFIVTCCLIKRRLFQYGISRNKGSIYSVFITAKTFDNVSYPDNNDDPLAGSTRGNGPATRDGPTRQSLFHSRRQGSYNTAAGGRSSMEGRGESEPSAGSRRYLTTSRSGSWESGQYIDLINPYFSRTLSDCERLPNLVDPKKSPFMVHRAITHPSSPAHRRPESQVSLLQDPTTVFRTLSDNADVPRVVVAKPLQSPSHPELSVTDSSGSMPEESRAFQHGGFDSPKFLTRSRRQPKPLPKSTASYSPSQSPKQSFFHSRRVKEVYAIGGTLTDDDLEILSKGGAHGPKPRPRKTILEAMHGRKKDSEPRLCSIRRVDHAGYEVPRAVRHQLTPPAPRNCYTTLRHSRREEHVYDEIHLEDEEDELFLQEADVAPGRPSGAPSGLMITDFRHSNMSQVGRYANLSNRPLSEEFRGESRPREGGKQGEGSMKENETETEGDSHQHRRQGAESPGHNKNGLEPQGEQAKAQERVTKGKPPAHADRSRRRKTEKKRGQGHKGGAGDSDDDSYEDIDVFDSDTDEDENDLWSECDYTDVFTRNRAAV